MLFICALDAVFELPPIVRQLFGHFVGPARHVATECTHDVHRLANLEFMRRHPTSHVWPVQARSPRRESPSRRVDPRPRLRTAQIQRIAENAPRRPDMNLAVEYVAAPRTDAFHQMRYDGDRCARPIQIESHW